MTKAAIYEVIRLDGPSVPLEVLERGPTFPEEATKQFARDLLESRMTKAQVKKLRKMPEGVRVTDAEGNELFRYTYGDLLRDRKREVAEQRMKERNPI